MGPIVLQSIAPLVHEAGGVVDCHLMVDDPAHHFAAFEAAGADSVTFHVEAADDPAAVAAKARDHGFQVGLAFNPETPVDEVAPLADAFDLVLCMSIHPGYSGQEFMPEAVGRIEQLRSLVPAHVHVQVDGGISHENIRSVYDAGADLIVAGSAIFGRWRDLPRAYRRLVQALCVSVTSSGRSSSPSAGAARLGRTRSSARSSSPAARSSARAGTSARAARTPRWSRSRRPASAPAARRST